MKSFLEGDEDAELYVGVDGVARKVKKVYVGVDGKARLCWQGGKDFVYGKNLISSYDLLYEYNARSTEPRFCGCSVGDYALFNGVTVSKSGNYKSQD